MAVLLDCKKFTDKDEQYVWTGRDMEVKEQTLSDFFSKRRIGDSETASLFKPFTLNNAYRFHNLTEYCNKHNINIMSILSHEFSNIRPYYKDMCDILGLTYIKNNNTALISNRKSARRDVANARRQRHETNVGARERSDLLDASI